MGIEQTIRQWRLIQLLHGRKRGLSVQKLMEELGTSHATLYRDIRALLEAGVPLHSETRTGEAWYSFEGASLVPLNPTSLQMAALTLGRTFLAALEGTQLVAEYDALLGRWTQTPPAALPIETPPPPVRSLKPLLATIEQALQKQRRLRIVYEGARGERGERIVDPVGLKIEQTIQLYFNAYDVEKNALKTYKPIRMQEAELLPDAAAPHPELDDEDPFAHSMKVWSAPPIDVAVQISARKARFVYDEWPMKRGDQQVDEQADGSVVVRARVAGPHEVSKWVLSWGRDAVVLSPPELREAMRNELAAALAGYAPSNPSGEG